MVFAGPGCNNCIGSCKIASAFPMRKFAFLLLLAAFSVAHAQDTLNADKKWIWSAGVESALPLGHFHDYSTIGLGASLQGEYKPGTRVGITLNFGFIEYFGNTVDRVKSPDFKYWPLMGGVKLYLTHSVYIHGKAGPGFGADRLGTSFWYGGGVGAILERALELELKYAGWKQNEVEGGGLGSGGAYSPGGAFGVHYSTVGLRLAYDF